MQYLVNRDEVLDKVARLEEHKAKLANIQMSLFLRSVILFFVVEIVRLNICARALRLTKGEGWRRQSIS